MGVEGSIVELELSAPERQRGASSLMGIKAPAENFCLGMKVEDGYKDGNKNED